MQLERMMILAVLMTSTAIGAGAAKVKPVSISINTRNAIRLTSNPRALTSIPAASSTAPTTRMGRMRVTCLLT
jgi:hypothetical protein